VTNRAPQSTGEPHLPDARCARPPAQWGRIATGGGPQGGQRKGM